MNALQWVSDCVSAEKRDRSKCVHGRGEPGASATGGRASSEPQKGGGGTAGRWQVEHEQAEGTEVTKQLLTAGRYGR